MIRQIRLNLYQPPEYDAPGSNKSWGRFNLVSDTLLMHPAGKLVSINAEGSKIEVLSLPEGYTTDDKAPTANVYSAEGLREGLVHGPVAAAISPKGVILVLESKNRRIQAFDLGGNPVKHFGPNKDQYHVPLKTETDPVMYLDMAVEFTGYLYVLSYVTQQGLYDLPARHLQTRRRLALPHDRCQCRAAHGGLLAKCIHTQLRNPQIPG